MARQPRIQSPVADDDLRIEYRAPQDLKPHPRNARTHSRGQIEALRQSIRRFGFRFPVAVDAEGQIIAGHGRVLAAAEEGLARIPIIAHGHLNAAEVRGLMLLDNQLATLSGWNEDILAAEIEHLAEVDLNAAAFGFDTDEPEEPKPASIVDAPMSASFWIAVEGPLLHQAAALHALKELAALPGVEVHSNLREEVTP